jgi:hypothetical protein
MNLIERLENHQHYAVHDEDDACSRAAEAIVLARTIAEWHLEDGDECGIIARRLFDIIEAQA